MKYNDIAAKALARAKEAMDADKSLSQLKGEVVGQYQQLQKSVPTATQFERDGVIAYTDQNVNAANENVAADMVFEF